MMQLFIHTLGRLERQVTLGFFSKALRKRTFLVVQKQEEQAWIKQGIPNRCELLVLPKTITTLSPTRQFILEWAAKNKMDKICMMDDDLRFDWRPDPDDWHLKVCRRRHVEAMFEEVEGFLDSGYLHAGVGPREGHNRVLNLTVKCTRLTRLLAYRPIEVLKLGCRFDRLRTKQDFDMTLQLLRKGYNNIVTYRYAQNQDTDRHDKGGCASYRTFDMMREDSYALAKLHPYFVKVLKKKTKLAWGGKERTDVLIYWQKALDSSTLGAFFERE